MSLLRFLSDLTTGDANAVGVGADVTGTAIFIGQSFQKARRLSSYANVTAETNTLTLTHQWQVSNDETTWYDVAHGPQNPAGVALATGTGSAVPGTKIFPAPEAIAGFMWARAAIRVGVVTGTALELWELGYNYRQQDPE